MGIFKTEAEGEEGRGDEIGPEDFEGREGEDGDTIIVLEGETDEEEDDLGDVGDQEVEQELGLLLLVMAFSCRPLARSGTYLLNVIKQPSSLFNGGDDGSKVVVSQNHICRLFGNITAAQSHGDAHV